MLVCFEYFRRTPLIRGNSISMPTRERLDDIMALAGEDLENAKSCSDDDGYLPEFQSTVVHYEVVCHS